jgi:hypothetical protein
MQGRRDVVGEVWRATPRDYTARLSRNGQTMDHIPYHVDNPCLSNVGKGGRGCLVHNRKQIANIVFVRD